MRLQRRWLFVFYLVIISLASYLFQRHVRKNNHLQLQIQDLREKINIGTEQNSRELKNKTAIQAKIQRYDSLKKIIVEINQNLSLETLANNLCSIAFSLIAGGKGTCILYLVDMETHSLSLFKAKKEDTHLIIKAKQGDIFDSWVLRHVSPLLVEDIKKDFRFDLEKLPQQDQRPILSLASAPLVSESRFLGILRLDNPSANFYTQDDLRFLVTICDLGAIALENSDLYQKTQELATHDGLTGIYTKGYFLERLKEEAQRSLRRNVVFSLLMLDIDYFKNYNDRFGHTAGDIVLKTLSKNIAESMKNLNPVTSRFGGEEFCVILPGVDKNKAVSAAQDLRTQIERSKIVLRRQETNVTVSIGVASFPQDAADADELILKADRAMYEAKQQGRNRVIAAG